jgi:hypothetical protein
MVEGRGCKVISLTDMVKNKASFVRVSLGLLALFLADASISETPNQAPSVSPTQPLPSSNGNNIKIFDDRVFNLEGGTSVPETRVSPSGTTRYLDNTKELDYNTEQRDRWLKNCASLKEVDYKAFRDCVESQKKKELGSRTNFGAREPRSSVEAPMAPAPSVNRESPSPMQGIAPASPRRLPEAEPEETELRDPTDAEMENAE